MIKRVVCLVPSLTEAIAVTDRQLLVGATDWCTHPADLDVTRVGGTKWPDVDAIRALQPDLVVANAEENRAEDLAALRDSGIRVWVTGPATVAQGIDSLGALLRTLTGSEPEWLRHTRRVWQGLVPAGGRKRAVIAIWRRPWMVLGRDTFAGDVLRQLGVDNVFADHLQRYPKVELNDERITGADLVVLPDEPYAFSSADGPDAFPGQVIALVSGRHLTWYGPSLAEAPEILRAQLSPSPHGDKVHQA
ncbi:MAG: ABC transporter substrate-binding protein [Geodermatophilaceae bacterium]|nr:ABC transporter substrate-binding protein [Geodermatophilaceae bacterium]